MQDRCAYMQVPITTLLLTTNACVVFSLAHRNINGNVAGGLAIVIVKGIGIHYDCEWHCG